MQQMKEIKAWEKRPNESSKAFRAFQAYLTLIDPNNPAAQGRSVERAAQRLNYNPKSISQLFKWSSEHDWVARCEAYDAYMASQIITYREVELAEYQAAVVGSLVQQLAVMDEVINKTLVSLREAMIADPTAVDPKTLVQMLGALEKKDNLARRAGKMPTAYTREWAQEDENLDPIFVIGGGDD